jgi:A/G-specific adenine glycosylase
LHACAVAICERHGGEVPDDVVALEALPGIGTYTARAVAAFAFGKRVPVVDTNVRRVLARLLDGVAAPGTASTVRDLTLAEALLPRTPARAARCSVALMELGALVCTARRPDCGRCPVADRCAWLAAGAPAGSGPTARTQRFAGSDRQVRGLLLDVLRTSRAPVPKAALELAWADVVQRERALDSLVVDGLVDPLPDGRFALPS